MADPLVADRLVAVVDPRSGSPAHAAGAAGRASRPRSAFRRGSASTMRRSTAKRSASGPEQLAELQAAADRLRRDSTMNDVFYLTEEQRMIRDLARKVARDRIAPHAAHVRRDRELSDGVDARPGRRPASSASGCPRSTAGRTWGVWRCRWSPRSSAGRARARRRTSAPIRSEACRSCSPAPRSRRRNICRAWRPASSWRPTRSRSPARAPTRRASGPRRCAGAITTS